MQKIVKWAGTISSMRDREAEMRGHGVTSHLVLQVMKGWGCSAQEHKRGPGEGIRYPGCWTRGFDGATAGMLMMGPEDHRRAVLSPV